MNQSAFSSTLAAPVSSCPVRFSKAIPGCARYNFWPHGASKNCVLLEGAAARFEANLKTSRRCRQKFSFLRISRLQKDVRASFDDEFRSSQSIALGLHKRYKSVLQGGIANNLHDFIEAGVTAYSVGCTTEDLRKELLNIGTREADLEDTPVSTGSVGIKTKLAAEEVEECILWTSILFITIQCTPQPTVVRWSSTPPVTAEAQIQWRGFCELIAKAYYERGMAWMSVKPLQMEQMAVSGYAEEPSLVADRMRLVFATLEV